MTAKHYVDTDAYRVEQIKLMHRAMLSEAYYHGNPYGMNDGMGILRANILLPPQEWTKRPDGQYEYTRPNWDYDYNIARERVTRMTAAVLPRGTTFHVEGVDEDQLKLLEPLLFNFGGAFPRNLKGLMQYAKQTLVSTAIQGDNLILMKQMPKDEERNLPARMRFVTYDFQDWSLEVDDRQDDEVLFYRVEWKDWKADGSPKGEVYWNRMDIYSDKIVRYTPIKAVVDPAWHLSYTGIEMIEKHNPWYFAPTGMSPQEPSSREMIESELIAKIGGPPCIPLVYEPLAPRAYRGRPEVCFEDMRAIDKANEQLYIWGQAVKETNFPMLLIWDAVMPKNPSGKSISGQQLSQPGAVHQMTSRAEQQGRVEYPGNIPTGDAFANVLEQIVRVAFGSMMPMGLKAEDTATIAELSGFAHSVINFLQEERAGDIRSRVIENGIVRAMNLGIQHLGIIGGLPAGVNADKIEVTVKYAQREITEDEKMKLMLVLQTMQQMGVPVEELVDQMPLNFKDRKAVVENMEKMQEEAAQMMDLMAKAKLQQPGGAAGKPNAKGAAGVDNRARNA